jgi:hypothetical protein
MSETYRGEYVFKVADIDATTAWIAGEPRHEGNPYLKQHGLSIGFDLRNESYESAAEAVELLNKYIKNVVIW